MNGLLSGSYGALILLLQGPIFILQPYMVCNDLFVWLFISCLLSLPDSKLGGAYNGFTAFCFHTVAST